MLDYIVAHLDVLISFVAGAFLYAYKKGKEDTIHKNVDHNLKIKVENLTTELEDNIKKYDDLKKIVNRVEEALDRSYVTREYVHLTFPSREIFDIKMEAVQENITNKIDSVVNMLKMHQRRVDD